MKFSSSFAAAFVSIIPFMTSGQQCTICPNGIEFPDATVEGSLNGRYSCKVDIETMTEVLNDPSTPSITEVQCIDLQRRRVPTCCPSYLDVLAANNACGFCHNGILKDEVCAEILFGTLWPFQHNTAEHCAGINSAYSSCCNSGGSSVGSMSNGSSGSGVGSTSYSVSIITTVMSFLTLFWSHNWSMP